MSKGGKEGGKEGGRPLPPWQPDKPLWCRSSDSGVPRARPRARAGAGRCEERLPGQPPPAPSRDVC